MMGNMRHGYLRLWRCTVVAVFLLLASAAVSGEPTGFRHRGFYLHEGWLFNYPFAVRSWSREDFLAMYRLLARLGFDQVMNWPMCEAIPAPLSETDAQALREYRRTITDAHAAGLEFWLAQCPNLTPPASIASKPWKDRNPYPIWKAVRLDDPAEAAAYFAHRRAIMQILNGADAYVTIDGDPGGYAGARPPEWLSVFLADRRTIDECGTDPARQRVIPWLWCGWGTDKVWGGDPGNAPAQIKPFVQASLDVLQTGLPNPWSLLPGRSSRDNWANGRVNIELADQAGLIPRSTIFCYEAIEFEPAIPGSILQFEQIRRILREESRYAGKADGVFGNAQQPIMVLPNLYFFSRAARDLSYLERTDDEVLAELANLLGGPRELLVPTWKSQTLPLAELPEELPTRLRETKLTGEAAAYIPGGPERYLKILAAEVEGRRGLLAATASRASTVEQAAKQLADGAKSLIDWWQVHHYVNEGDRGTPFAWKFVRGQDVAALRKWAAENVTHREKVIQLAARQLSSNSVLDQAAATQRLLELF